MNLTQLLEQRKADILSQATAALARARLAHYDEAELGLNEARLQALYDLMVHCISERDLTAMIRYAENLAQERFKAGFDLREVQTAFNVLEEVTWRQVIQDCPPSQLAEALGLISTVHGAGKDALAVRYIALASKTKPTSLNLAALFKGTDGV